MDEIIKLTAELQTAQAEVERLTSEIKHAKFKVLESKRKFENAFSFQIEGECWRIVGLQLSRFPAVVYLVQNIKDNYFGIMSEKLIIREKHSDQQPIYEPYSIRK